MKKVIYINILFLFLLFSCEKEISINTWTDSNNVEINNDVIINNNNNNNNTPIENESTNSWNVVESNLDENDLLNSAIQFINNDELEKAEVILLNLYNNNNTDINILWNLWNLYLKASKFSEAEKYFITSNKILDGKDKNTLLNLGVVYFNLDNIEASKEYVNKSLILDKNFQLAKDFLKTINQ